MKISVPSFLLCLIFASPSFAGTTINGLPTGLTAPCDIKADNQKKIDQALADPQVAQACHDQIKTSTQACLTEPSLSDIESLNLSGGGASGRGLPQLAQAQLDGLNLAKARYLAHSDLCKRETSKVADTCKQMQEALQTAIRNNGQLPVGAEQMRVNLELQGQRDRTGQAAGVAGHAYEDEVHCADNLVNIYQSEIDRTAGVLARATAGVPGAVVGAGSAIQPVGDPIVSGTRDNSIAGGATVVTKAAGEAAESVSRTSLQTGLKALGSAAKVVGPAGVVYSVYDGDAVSTVTAGTQVIAEVAAPEAAAAAIAGPLAGVGLFLHSTPTATCDVWVSNPVQGYRTGCPVNSLAGAQTNEQAITALNH